MEDLDQSPRVNPAHESSENEPPEAKSEEEESIQDLFRMKREVRKAEIEELLAIPIKAPVFLGSKDDLTTQDLVTYMVDDELVHDGDFRVGDLVWTFGAEGHDEKQLGVVLDIDASAHLVTVQNQDGTVADEPLSRVKSHSLPGVTPGLGGGNSPEK